MNPPRTTRTPFGWIASIGFDLRALDADSALAGQQTFQFIVSQAFSVVDGELRATRTLLAADTDGDRQADLLIHLKGNVLLDSSNLLL